MVAPGGFRDAWITRVLFSKLLFSYELLNNLNVYLVVLIIADLVP